MTSLTPIITSNLLSSARKQPNLPKNSWYFVTAVTLSMLNRPDELPRVYRYAIESNAYESELAPTTYDERLNITRRMREALVKASAVGGMPKSINALLALKAATPEDLLDDTSGPSPTRRSADIYETPVTSILQRGQDFFENVYGKISRRVMGQMDRSGTEDLGLVARLVYGYVLSNTHVLSSVETSYVLIAGLIPQDVNPQLKGHLRGALNGGATVEEVRAVRQIVIAICEAAGMQRLRETSVGGWGWRSEVANV